MLNIWIDIKLYIMNDRLVCVRDRENEMANIG